MIDKVAGVVLTVALISGFTLGTVEAIHISKKNAGTVSPTRAIEGIVINREFPEDSDTTNVQILTDDGNLWSLDNFSLNLNARVEVEFDTMGTDNIEDDVITSVKVFVR